MKNPILNADSYTISSDGFAPESARQFSCYNFTNRYSPTKAFPEVAKDSRMVLYGVRHFVENYMTSRVTIENVREAELFMERAHSFGGKLYFPKDLWMKVVNECGGYLPVTIKSLPDGSVFFPNEPVIQVTASDGFGELAAHIESRLVGCVSRATVTATLCRHWLERLKEEVKKDKELLGQSYSDKEITESANWQVHNFGDRACMTGEESLLSSMAHLLSFNGTDSTSGALEAWQQGAKNPVATSILALAHRNVISWDTEINCFSAIAERETTTRNDKFKIVACVSDAYDFDIGYKRVASLAISNQNVVFICRPDSGNGLSQILNVCEYCKSEEKLHRIVNGFYLPTNLRIIYGDSISPNKQFEIYEAMRNSGFPPTEWMIVGCGGYIVNNSLRDTFSSAYKLAATFNGPRIKISNTPSKMSIPFETSMLVTDSFTNKPRVLIGNDNDSRVTIYDRGIINKSYYGYNFSDVRDMVQNKFNSMNPYNNKFGLNRESLCQEIIDFQNSYLKK